jgi:predicted PurR-regulated permease PerM
MNTKKKYVNLALLTLVYGAFFYILLPFTQIIVFGALFAFALSPILEKMHNFKKVKLSDLQSITILVSALFILLFLPLGLIIGKVASLITKMNADQIADAPLVQKAQDLFTKIINSVNGMAQNFGFDLTSQFDVKSHAAEIGQGALAFATAIITNAPEALLQFAFFIALVYYFLLNQSRLKASFLETNLLSETQVRRLTKLLQKVCNTVLISTVLIAFLQATVVTLGALFVGYDYLLLIFIIAFFLSFTPVLGSAPITIVLIGYALINGEYGHAVVLSIVAFVAGTLDNVIKTYVFSYEKESVSPLIALLTIIGSLTMFGPLGLFLGPVIAELAVKIGKIVDEDNLQ